MCLGSFVQHQLPKQRYHGRVLLIPRTVNCIQLQNECSSELCTEFCRFHESPIATGVDSHTHWTVCCPSLAYFRTSERNRPTHKKKTKNIAQLIFRNRHDRPILFLMFPKLCVYASVPAAQFCWCLSSSLRGNCCYQQTQPKNVKVNATHGRPKLLCCGDGWCSHTHNMSLTCTRNVCWLCTAGNAVYLGSPPECSLPNKCPNYRITGRA